MTTDHWSLPDALGIAGAPELVAFVGGGGKTSLMFALAAALPGRTVVTTTTRIFAAQMRLAPAVCAEDDLSRLGEHLARRDRCLVVGRVDGDKALGVDPALPARLLTRPDVDYVLVEADGSRMRPVKAPADHEPVIPPETTLLVPLAGIDALERPLEVVAHRPERVRALLAEAEDDAGSAAAGRESPTTSGDSFGDDRLTAAGLARLLTHPQGGLKGAPAGARVVPFINKVETAAQLEAAGRAAQLTLNHPRIERAVLGAVRAAEPVVEVRRRVTAVVLAAGQSSRMGRNKLLLPWGETTVLGRVLATLKQTTVHDVLVVTGHDAARTAAVAAEAGVGVIHNPDYAAGEMLSSLQTAVAALPPDRAAVLAVLADQPAVEVETIEALLAAYRRTPGELLAPVYEGRRGNPALIGRRYFAELMALPPGAAPRDLLRRRAADLRLIPVASDSILRDVDSNEAYERWRPR